MEKYIWEYHNPYEWLERVQQSSFPPLMICVAITGGVHGKEANPALPETPEEQVEQTLEAYRAGATMVHIHARDPEKWWDGADNAEQYRKVNGMIRGACPEIIINNTTGGSLGMTLEQRVACLDAGPEVATLNLGPDMYKFKFKERKAPLPHPKPEEDAEGVLPVTYAELRRFATAMQERGIKPEMEVYHPGQLWAVLYLADQELVQPAYFIQFVMGYGMCPWATPRNLVNFMDQLPSPSIVEVAGLGPFQSPMTTLAMILGAQMVRVGMEDNIYHRRGQLLKSNAEAVERVVRIANELNREIATPAVAREMLGISEIPSKY
ncbi:MAG: 3-keto-5-aminohexanoate cleavage protein [Promethearchaeota archaeon]